MKRHEKRPCEFDEPLTFDELDALTGDDMDPYQTMMDRARAVNEPPVIRQALQFRALLDSMHVERLRMNLRNYALLVEWSAELDRALGVGSLSEHSLISKPHHLLTYIHIVTDRSLDDDTLVAETAHGEVQVPWDMRSRRRLGMDNYPSN